MLERLLALELGRHVASKHEDQVTDMMGGCNMPKNEDWLALRFPMMGRPD